MQAIEKLSHAHTPTIWRLATMSAQPIVLMRDGSDKRHVYCVHSVTGDVAGLDRFASHLDPLRIEGIQVPKRDMARHCGSTIETIARHHVARLVEHQSSGPIHLIGWSAGAIIALEMAQQLRARGREVPLLVALDGAPCNTDAGLDARDPRYVLRMVANLPRWIRDDRTSDWSMVGIRKRIAEKIAANRGPRVLQDVDTLDAGSVEGILAKPGWSPTQKAFVHGLYAALAAYKPTPYDGPTLVFETGTQPLFHLRQVGAAWRAIASNCEIVPVRGNHSGLIREPAATLLATEVALRLRR